MGDEDEVEEVSGLQPSCWGNKEVMMMYESKTLQRFSAYISENKIKAALETEVKYMAAKANDQEKEVNLEGPGRDFEFRKGSHCTKHKKVDARYF